MKKPVQFDIITLFPEAIESYCASSILGAAQIKKIISIRTHGLRLWGIGAHKKVDERVYGGGAGMVLMPEPIIRAISAITKKRAPSNKRKIIILSAKGKQWNQKLAYEWSKKYDEFIFVSGRYEGIDERVVKILGAEEISIGPYVLTDGDVASMAVISSVARLIPEVIKSKSLAEESHWNLFLKNKKNALTATRGLEYPHYTRPEVFEYKGKKYRVPKVLLSGDHKKIDEWRAKHSA
ncbi:MAG: tRNA (guanosine(37)-N1)-methyltransferase TrmD [Patescibacteria group bacterium]